jgi:hypothetical protein
VKIKNQQARGFIMAVLQDISTGEHCANISMHVQFSSSKKIERPADRDGVVLFMLITENMSNARIAVAALGRSLLSKMTGQYPKNGCRRESVSDAVTVQ